MNIAMPTPTGSHAIRGYSPMRPSTSSDQFRVDFASTPSQARRSNETTNSPLTSPANETGRQPDMSTVLDIAHSRSKDQLMRMLSLPGLGVLVFDDDDALPINLKTCEYSVNFIRGLTEDFVLPKVSPDGEGDIMLVWGKPARLLVTVEGEVLHVIVHPASKSAKYLPPINFNGYEIPSEVAKLIPRR